MLGGGLPPPPQLPQGADGAPKDDDSIEPGEVLIASADMQSAVALGQALQAQGYRVLRRRVLRNLGMVISTIGLPPGTPVAGQLGALRQVNPQQWMDANHRYRLMAGGGAGPLRHAAEQLLKWPRSGACQGKGQRIGLLDTQIHADRAGLGGRLVQQSFLSAGVEPAVSPHGTEVAALLASPAGLLPQARLLAGGIFRQRGKAQDTTAEILVRALDWLLGQQVRVINLSLGGPRNLVVELALQRVMAQDVAVVAAAGNGGADGPPVYPAAQPGVLAVTAVDQDRHPYRKATHGDYVDLSAPGVDVFVPLRDGPVYRSGTSYAAPFVSAALALALESGRSVEAARGILLRGTLDLGPPGRDPVFGQGLLQAPVCP